MNITSNDCEETTGSLKVKEVEVCQEDPFKEDLLNRQETAKQLTNLIRHVNEGGTVFVDAGWGQGKTTFIKMWSAYLQSSKIDAVYSVIEFNAWSSDYSDTPFVPLAKKLTSELGKHLGTKKKQEIFENLKKTGKEALKMIAYNVVGKLTAGLVTGKNAETLIDIAFDTDKSDDETIIRFKDSLATASDVLRQDTHKPLILIIDELDRCRPLYAIEMLETIKHLFSVPHMVFVLVVNLHQMSNSIRSVYGDEFDANEYLRRFRDIDFRLPDADEERRKFIQTKFQSDGLVDYVKRSKLNNLQTRVVRCQKLFEDVAIAYGWSLRDIEQQLKRLEAIYSDVRDNHIALIESCVLLLILSQIDSYKLSQFIRGELTDLEYVDLVFGKETPFNSLDRNQRLRIIAMITYGHLYQYNPEGEISSDSPRNTLFVHVSNSDSLNVPDELDLLLNREDLQAIRDMKSQYSWNYDNPSIPDNVKLLETYKRLEFGSASLITEETD